MPRNNNPVDLLPEEPGDLTQETADFTELATKLGMKALLKLITDQALTGGTATLRIVVNDAVWEISAKCLIRKGPWVCGLALFCGMG
jgi:hypothetical protein